MPKPPRPSPSRDVRSSGYAGLVGDIGMLLEQARRASARAVNSLMTATYWEIGRRIVEFEQGGKKRAAYGEALLQRLSGDLTTRYGRGFSFTNLKKYRQFCLAYPLDKIGPTVSGQSAGATLPTLLDESGFDIGPTRSGSSTDREISSPLSIESEVLPLAQAVSGKTSTPSRLLSLGEIARAFPLPWSHYVLLMPNKLLVREYLTALPDEQVLSGEIERTRRQLEARSGTR